MSKTIHFDITNDGLTPNSWCERLTIQPGPNAKTETSPLTGNRIIMPDPKSTSVIMRGKGNRTHLKRKQQVSVVFDGGSTVIRGSGVVIKQRKECTEIEMAVDVESCR